MTHYSECKQLSTCITCFILGNLCGDIEGSIMHFNVRNWFVNSGPAEAYKQTTHWTAKQELLYDLRSHKDFLCKITHTPTNVVLWFFFFFTFYKASTNENWDIKMLFKLAENFLYRKHCLSSKPAAVSLVWNVIQLFRLVYSWHPTILLLLSNSAQTCN